MPQLSSEEARDRFAAARVARLATIDESGRPHLVPMVFVVYGDIVYNAVDHKPKRTATLRRFANVAANPAVSLLVDYYEDEDWDALWWCRADGSGRLVEPGSAEERDAIARLRDRYLAYVDRPPHGQVLAADVWRWSGWAARSK